MVSLYWRSDKGIFRSEKCISLEGLRKYFTLFCGIALVSLCRFDRFVWFVEWYIFIDDPKNCISLSENCISFFSWHRPRCKSTCNVFRKRNIHVFITSFTGVFRTRNFHVFICTLSQCYISFSGAFRTWNIHVFIYTLSQCFHYKSTAGYVVTNEMRVSNRQQLRFGSCQFDEPNKSVESTTLNRRVCCQ